MVVDDGPPVKFIMLRHIGPQAKRRGSDDDLRSVSTDGGGGEDKTACKVSSEDMSVGSPSSEDRTLDP